MLFSNVLACSGDVLPSENTVSCSVIHHCLLLQPFHAPAVQVYLTMLMDADDATRSLSQITSDWHVCVPRKPSLYRLH